MNITALNEYCESYLFKYDIVDNNLKNKLVEDIRLRISNLKDDDIELYNMYWDKSTSQQIKIVEEYIKLTFINDKYPIYEFDLFTGIGSIIGGGATIGGGIIASLGGMINSLATALGATLTGAGGIISGIMTPMGLITVGSLLFLLAVTTYGRTITKGMFKTLHSIGTGMDFVGGKILKLGRDFKFRYAILQKNYEACYITAGIKQEDIQLLHYLHVGDKPFPLTTEKIFTQSRELQKCYMTYCVKSIGLLSKAYFNCLRKTGDINNIGMGDDIMKMISGTNISSMCMDLYDDMKHAFDVYYDLIEFAYDDNQEKKKNALNELKEELIQSKKTSQGFNRDKSGGFNKDKFKGGGKQK